MMTCLFSEVLNTPIQFLILSEGENIADEVEQISNSNLCQHLIPLLWTVDYANCIFARG